VNMDQFLNRLYHEQPRVYPEHAGYDEDLRNRLRSRLPDLLGGFPASKAELDPVLLETTELEGLRVERVEYATFEHVRVSAYVLIPKHHTGRLPAVLACHGRGYGHKEALGLRPDGMPAEEPGIHNKFAVRLAQRGMLVMVPEIMGFGERRLQADRDEAPDGRKSSCNMMVVSMLMRGKTLAGFRVYEAMRAIDYLETRTDVDSGRIGIMGFSGGGLIGSLTAALDRRIRATVICGYTNTYKGSILAMPHCIDNYISGILQYAEQPEIMGLIAPRTLFIESGEKDPIFPVDHVREAINRLRRIYEAMNAGDRLEADIFPGGHEISGRKSLDWLKNKLNSIP